MLTILSTRRKVFATVAVAKPNQTKPNAIFSSLALALEKKWSNKSWYLRFKRPKASSVIWTNAFEHFINPIKCIFLHFFFLLWNDLKIYVWRLDQHEELWTDSTVERSEFRRNILNWQMLFYALATCTGIEPFRTWKKHLNYCFN